MFASAAHDGIVRICTFISSLLKLAHIAEIVHRDNDSQAYHPPTISQSCFVTRTSRSGEPPAQPDRVSPTRQSTYGESWTVEPSWFSVVVFYLLVRIVEYRNSSCLVGYTICEIIC